MEESAVYGGKPGPQIESLARACKALGDASRLRLLALLAHGERPAGALARAVGLTPATVSHHLARLAEAGLVTQRKAGTVRFYTLAADRLAALGTEELTPEGLRTLVAGPAGEVAGVAAPEPSPAPEAARPWTRKEQEVLGAFVVAGRIRAVPVSRRNRLVVLRWAAARLEARRYGRAELDAALAECTRDPAGLRRHLADEGFLAGDADGYEVQAVSK
jgi:DNA-binding transcriptional ArsR family regulator